MSALYSILIAVHVAANLVWIGSILCVGHLLVAEQAEMRDRARYAHELYRRLAAPAFGISLVAGVARLSLSAQYYFVDTKFMHPKLLFAVIVIALHHVIGARAKAVSGGRRSSPGPTGVLSLLLLISAVAATLFVVLEPF